MKWHLNSYTIFPRYFFQSFQFEEFFFKSGKKEIHVRFRKSYVFHSTFSIADASRKLFSFDKLTENFTVQHVFDRENFVRFIEYLDKLGITGYQTYANHEFIK